MDGNKENRNGMEMESRKGHITGPLSSKLTTGNHMKNMGWETICEVVSGVSGRKRSAEDVRRKISMKKSKITRKAAQRKREAVCQVVSGLSGRKRSAEDVRRNFSMEKSKITRKAAQRKREVGGTGGGPPLPPLADWEEVLCEFIGEEGLIGCAGQTLENPIFCFIDTPKSRAGSEQGIPLKIVSDNGPQISSREYKSFTEKWNIQHLTSSPHYPQSNGLKERAIQTVKATLRKGKMTGGDPHLALLCLRTTPIDSSLPLPAELLQGRKFRSNLPMKVNHSPHCDEVYEKFQRRQERQKDVFDARGVRDLPPLTLGQKVTMLDHGSGTWKPATVIEKCQEPRSYVIKIPNGSVLHRNRRDLRSLGQPQKRVQFDIPKDPEDGTPSRPKNNYQTNPTNQPGNNGYHTRSGRLVKTPDRLIEK